jgi:hypothetical protein
VLPLPLFFLGTTGSSSASGGKEQNDPDYGAGTCTNGGILWNRKYSCAYLCAIHTGSGLFSAASGPLVFKASQVDAACGHGIFCPKLLTIENANPGWNNGNVNILSCVN